MRRLHLFEFTDLPWYPQAFRRMQTDYLQFVATRGSGQAGLVPLLVKAMQHAGTSEIVDLCSGGRQVAFGHPGPSPAAFGRSLGGT